MLWLSGRQAGNGAAASPASPAVGRPPGRNRFQQRVGAVPAGRGQDLPRTKGILHSGGDDGRFAFQAVHVTADGDHIGP